MAELKHDATCFIGRGVGSSLDRPMTLSCDVLFLCLALNARPPLKHVHTNVGAKQENQIPTTTVAEETTTFLFCAARVYNPVH